MGLKCRRKQHYCYIACRGKLFTPDYGVVVIPELSHYHFRRELVSAVKSF